MNTKKRNISKRNLNLRIKRKKRRKVKLIVSILCGLALLTIAMTKLYNDKDQYLILVNKQNKVGYKHTPNDLTVPYVRFNASSDMDKNMRLEAANALENMFNDAERDGIILFAISGYRSYEYQQSVYDNSVATQGQDYTNKYVAIPGTSEHQTGLAMDVASEGYFSLESNFEESDAFKWLSQNMSNYGFIIRYPKGKEDITGYNYEPWHLRYVGVGPAKEITDNGLTLEEYLER
jgi:zinc D-Ala-D-Ala carboxypeptidase